MQWLQLGLIPPAGDGAGIQSSCQPCYSCSGGQLEAIAIKYEEHSS